MSRRQPRCSVCFTPLKEGEYDICYLCDLAAEYEEAEEILSEFFREMEEEPDYRTEEDERWPA